MDDSLKIKGKRIYLACPYSHKLGSVREARFQICNFVASDLMRKGGYVYSPISHTHPIAEAGELPTDWKFWKKYNTQFLEWCEVLIVIHIAGQEISKGVIEESSIAYKLGKQLGVFSFSNMDIPERIKNLIEFNNDLTLAKK